MIRILVPALLALVLGCQAETAPSETSSGARCTPAGQGVAGPLFGALAGQLSAHAEPASCAGRTRPGAAGVRLQFRAEPTPELPALVVILGIDDLQREQAGNALRTTVTLIDEDAQRFFSTAGQPSCFSDIARHTALRDRLYTELAGTLWCTSAVPALNGTGTVRITGLEFNGVVKWPDPA